MRLLSKTLDDRLISFASHLGLDCTSKSGSTKSSDDDAASTMNDHEGGALPKKYERRAEVCLSGESGRGIGQLVLGADLTEAVRRTRKPSSDWPYRLVQRQFYSRFVSTALIMHTSLPLHPRLGQRLRFRPIHQGTTERHRLSYRHHQCMLELPLLLKL